MNPQKRSEAGYTLAEMLTVVAIIGTLALVSVPSFITFYNSNKMKASMRELTNDLRATRQLAISTGRQAMLTYPTGTSARSYAMFVGDKPFGSTTWNLPTNSTSEVRTRRSSRTLEEIVYFPADSGSTPQTFTDTVDCTGGTTCTSGSDGKIDVIFFPDGHVLLPANATSATMTLKTDRKIPKRQYAIAISPTGRVQVQ
jgi:prepilin-type N-terminal cleavage/methylation domain-containing protein